ncbi:hypothetical protein AKJ09_08497 [Labilithrix luteola]|uniref:Uncharacterized protein n=1 Tax=Labilithrix luteola TaxID=1391654 RepID=A0A0K1Q7Y4_9BACT|nr:hypothetical protein AKJ09_08497 [Labilithrix luteola]
MWSDGRFVGRIRRHLASRSGPCGRACRGEIRRYRNGRRPRLGRPLQDS